MRMPMRRIVALLLSVSASSVRAQRPNAAAEWTGMVGAVALLVPAYEGAVEHRLIPFPLVRMSFRDRIYLGPSAMGPGGVIGAGLIRQGSGSIAVEMGMGGRRPSSRSDALAGMDDRGIVGSFGVKAEYHLRAIDALLTASTLGNVPTR